MKRLSITNFSSENNLLMFQLNTPVVIKNVSKLFSEQLKFIADNLLFIQLKANKKEIQQSKWEKLVISMTNTTEDLHTL